MLMSHLVAVPAVLSVRLPAPSRDRLKAAAAARGETVQGLVGGLVARFLLEEERRAPELAAALGALRAGAPGLRRRSVRALWVVGAVARGEARPGAAVELVAEFEPGARPSLVGLASLRAELSALLGAPATLAEHGALPTGAARETAERDAVRAL
jgi:predicted nucleotidyltransferase